MQRFSGPQSPCKFGLLVRHKKLFALPQNDKFEILASSDESTTYVAKDGVYVFKGNEQVLTGSKEIVVAKHGRLVAIKDGQILIEKRGEDESVLE